MPKTEISTVDDSKDILSVIRNEFLNDVDYNFKFFSDGSDFLCDLSEDVDLVILDIHLPGFDVIEAVEKIDEVAPMAYVIIISGDKDFGQLVNLTNMGIFRFCVKDGHDFLPNLRKYISAAHRKITIRKGFIGVN